MSGEMSTNTFGMTLKALREKRGVSQSKLAEQADFDHSYVSRLESAQRMPTKEAALRLGRAMNLDSVARDMLLAAGGYVPEGSTSLIAYEPEVAEVFAILQSGELSPDFSSSIRSALNLLAEQAKVHMKLIAMASAA